MSTEPSSPSALPDGYTGVPSGKIAAVVTYLEMGEPPRREAQPNRAAGWELVAIGSEVERYLALFRRVGEPWLWFSRLAMPEAELRGILASPDVEAFALRHGGEDIGLLELDFRRPGECELSFLGLAPEAIGRGVGRFLVETAIERAFARPIRRLWVHTCTFDHPSCVEFYRRAGFKPYGRAVEIAEDPRLSGLLPRSAAPHVPLIER
jgi:GNAT superfamily N-acetyltransferase